MKKYIVGKIFCSLFLLFASLLLLEDNFVGALIAGILSLFFNAGTIFEVKDNNYLIILFSLILYINLSAFVLGVLTLGITFNDYQWAIWHSKYNAIGMKSILVSSCMFYIVMANTTRVEKKRSIQIVLDTDSHKNDIICFSCLLVTLFACFFGFNGSAENGHYVSNNNPIFEYAILFYVFAWTYKGKNKFWLVCWYGCSAVYIAIAFAAGDRSSSFMLLFIIALYNLNKISIGKLIVFGFLGITLANIINQYRVSGLERVMLSGVFEKGLKTFFSDTAAQSYYTALTIYEYNDIITNQIQLFFNWIISIFTGGLIVKRDSVDLPRLASMYDINGGGGLFQPYFYLLFKYWGVAIGSLITAYIIKNVYRKWNNGFCNMLKVLIPAMSLRWYLYFPTVLYRTCIVNFFIIYIFVKAVDKLTAANPYAKKRLG